MPVINSLICAYQYANVVYAGSENFESLVSCNEAKRYHMNIFYVEIVENQLVP